jgi:trimethylamine:corrinoid methyltransferase-like protein
MSGAAWLDEKDEVGPGGNYLMSGLTLRHCREVDCRSPIFPRLRLEEWLGQGKPRALELLRQYTTELMARHPAPEDHGELIAQGEGFIRRLRAA